MAELRFEWNRGKVTENKRKHGVSFQEAESIFYDEYAILIDDPEHSVDEDRFLLLGLSSAVRTLVVAHCYRESDEVIRIISARKATRTEQKTYYRRWQK